MTIAAVADLSRGAENCQRPARNNPIITKPLTRKAMVGRERSQIQGAAVPHVDLLGREALGE